MTVSSSDKAVGRFPTTVDLGSCTVDLDAMRAAAEYATAVVPDDGLRDVLEAIGWVGYEGHDRTRSGGQGRPYATRAWRPGHGDTT